MTEAHKRPYRHPKYKAAFRVNNWRKYEQSLRARGDITLWMTPEAVAAWRAPMTGKRGAQPIYADIAIETAIALRLLFHLPLRQTDGFLGSVLRLMDLTLPCPDHTTMSRRNATVAIRRQVDRWLTDKTQSHYFFKPLLGMQSRNGIGDASHLAWVFRMMILSSTHAALPLLPYEGACNSSGSMSTNRQ